MDHTQFKAKQTAAAYVADGLDVDTLEAFEMHLMDCAECLEDVETWRAVRHHMPGNARPVVAPAAISRQVHAPSGWRMAASLVIGGIVGVTGGWFGREAQAPNLDSTQTAFFNVPAATRGGGECTPLRLAPDTRFAVLRVPGVARDRHVVAADSEKRELPASRYTSRLQADGSHLVRIETQVLTGVAVQLEAQAADGFGEPLGCVTGEVVASR